MTVEDIEEAILRLPPAELAKFRAWFADFEAGRVKEAESTANRLGRLWRHHGEAGLAPALGVVFPDVQPPPGAGDTGPHRLAVGRVEDGHRRRGRRRV